MAAPKGPGGRPTKYKDEYCREIVNIMAEGFSLTAAAAELGLSRETVYAWERDGEHPEFSDAVKVARAKRTLKLERDLLSAEAGPVVTSRIFALKNACPSEWADKVVNEHSGPSGGPIEISDKETARRLAFLLTKGVKDA